MLFTNVKTAEPFFAKNAESPDSEMSAHTVMMAPLQKSDK